MDTFLKCYNSPTPTLWEGRADSLPQERFFQIVNCIDLLENELPHETKPSYAFVGFSSDEGVQRNLGRAGAAEGPAAIRQALAKLPISHDNPRHCYDLGDIACHDHDLEATQSSLADLIERLFANHIKPIILGGGHEVAWGHFQGLAKAFPDAKIGIINIDAHFDLRPMHDDKGTSGTPFLQIANFCKQHNTPFNYLCYGIQKAGNTTSLFQTAEAMKVKYILADDIQLNTDVTALDEITDFLSTQDLIYLTVCLDVFSAAVAPGVSAPQSLGLYPWHVIPLLQHIANSGKVVSFDIAELAPRLDRDNMTAQLAAHLILKYIDNDTNFSRSEK